MVSIRLRSNDATYQSLIVDREQLVRGPCEQLEYSQISEVEDRDNSRKVEVEDNGHNGTDEGEEGAKDIAEDRANKGDDDAEQATNKLAEVNKSQSTDTTENTMCTNPMGAMIARMPVTSPFTTATTWASAVKRRQSRPARRLATSARTTFAVPSTVRRMTSTGWPTSKFNALTVSLRTALTSTRIGPTASTVALPATMNSREGHENCH